MSKPINNIFLSVFCYISTTVHFKDGTITSLPMPYTTKKLITDLYTDDVPSPVTDIVLMIHTSKGTPVTIDIQPNGITLSVNGQEI